MEEVGLEVPGRDTPARWWKRSGLAEEIGFPVMVRPSFILGGGGTGIAHDPESFIEVARKGLDTSPVGEILVEESVYGWKEFELEVMRDRNDNAVIVCSIENLDPMGVHTGDSITVAPDPDAVRSRVPGNARRRHQGPAGDRGRDRRLQCPVCGRSGHRSTPRDRDEPAGLTFVGPGFEGNRVSRSPRSPPSSRSDTPSTRSPTTSPVPLPPRSSPPSTMWSSRFPASTSPSSPVPPIASGPRCGASARRWPSGAPFPKRCRRHCAAWRTGGRASTATPERARSSFLADEELWSAVEVPTPHRIFAVGEALRRGFGVEAGGGDQPRSTRGSSSRCPRSSMLAKDLEEQRVLDRLSCERAKRLGFSDRQLAYLWGLSEDEVRKRRLAGGHPHHLQDGRHLRGRVRGPHALHVRHLRG